MSWPVNVVHFGAKPDSGVTDNAEPIQRALNTAAKKGRTAVYIPPSKDGYYAMGAGLNVDHTIRLYSEMPGHDQLGHYGAQLRFEGEMDAAVTVDHTRVHIDGLQVRAGPGVDKIIAIGTHHWPRVRNCYLGGAPRTAAIWLAGTLYAVVEHNTFSIQNDATAIDARHSNWKGEPYGTNASLIAHNSIFSPGPAYVGASIVDIIGNQIENTNSVGGGKVVFAGPARFKAVVARNYFELRRRAADSQPLKAIDVRAGIALFCSENSIFTHGARQTGSIAIDTRTGHVSGSIRDNHLTRWEIGIAARTPDSGRLELSGNVFDQVVTEIGPWFEPTQSVLGHKGGAHYNGSFEGGTVRRGWPDREIPVALENGSAGILTLAKGANWIIVDETTPDLNIVDAASHSGAIITIRFQQPARLEHAPGRFHLATGRSLTIPAGNVLQFLVGHDARVHEIGDTTRRLDA